MRRLLWCSTILIALAVGLLAREFEAAASQAGVASADNVVQKQTRGTAAWVACAVGDILSPGDRIKTGPDSSASLLFTDKTVMRMGEKTTIVIVDLSETPDGKLVRKFEQPAGRTWSDVTPDAAKPTTYEIRGPNAVAAVKGTAFEMDADADNTDVLCWRGEVECLATDDPVPQRIVAGQENRFQARRGQRPARMRFDPQTVDAFQKWNQENYSKQQAFFKSHPGRLKLNKAQLESFKPLRELKLTTSQRARLQQKIQKWKQNHPGTRPGGGDRPRRPNSPSGGPRGGNPGGGGRPH